MESLEQLLQLAPGTNWMTIWLTCVSLAGVLVHVGFAGAVGVHSRRRPTAMVPAWLWVLATLTCGPLVAIGYWVMHASQLAPSAPERRPR